MEGSGAQVILDKCDELLQDDGFAAVFFYLHKPLIFLGNILLYFLGGDVYAALYP